MTKLAQAVAPTASTSVRSSAAGLLIAIGFSAILLAPYLTAGGLLLWRMDGGYFAYVAQQWLHGATLYRDVLDQKPPLIFAADALGLWLASGHTWGIALASGLSTTAFAALFWRNARRLDLSPVAVIGALGAVFLWLTNLESLNSVGCFALPVHMLLVYLSSRGALEGNPTRYMHWIGLCTGVLFWFRPNAIVSGGFVLLASVFTSHGVQARMRLIARFSAGAALPALTIVGIASYAGVLKQMWQAMLGFNLAYLQVTPLSYKFLYVLFAFESFAETGLLVLGLATAVWALLMLRLGQVPQVIVIASLVLLAELLAGAPSGRLYLHYATPVLPACGLLTAWLLDRFEKPLAFMGAPGAALLTFLSIVMCLGFAFKTAHLAWKTAKERPPELALAQHLASMSQPSQSLYIWGMDRISASFLADRPSPSRFFTPAFAFQSEGLFNQLMPQIVHDLETHPPALIADCGPGGELYLFPESQSRLARPTAASDLPGWNSPAYLTRRARLFSAYDYAFVDAQAACVVYRKRQ